MAIEIVRQSVIASLAKLMQTVTMTETEAMLTPSRKAENGLDFCMRGTRGFSPATNTKEGRKAGASQIKIHCRISSSCILRLFCSQKSSRE
jgi:hypothetical protein